MQKQIMFYCALAVGCSGVPLGTEPPSTTPPTGTTSSNPDMQSSSPAFSVCDHATQLGGQGASQHTGDTPVGSATGDFNRDGKLDLAVVNRASGDISILLGNGDGTFAAATNIAIPGGSNIVPQAIVSGDFNGDGHIDLAVASAGDVALSMWYGRGDGTFASATIASHAGAVNPVAIVSGDFNGDGAADFALANFDTTHATSNFSLYFGDKSAGTYAVAFGSDVAVEQPSTLDAPLAITTGDFNNDGKLDIVTTNVHAVVFLNHGDGTFAPVVHAFAIANGACGVATGDFNGDGKLDIVHTESGQPWGILYGNGDGTFQNEFSPPDNFGGDYSAVQTVDFDGDGKIDLVFGGGFDNVLAQSGPGKSIVHIMFGNGNGTFRDSLPIGNVPYSAVSLGDFNGDGTLDVAGVHANFDIEDVYGNYPSMFNSANIVLTKTHAPPLAVSDLANVSANIIDAADYDSDGKLDLLTDQQLLFGNGDGTFTVGLAFWGYSPIGFTVTGAWPTGGDFNGDGKRDLITFTSSSGKSDQAYVYLGIGSGSFVASSSQTIGAQAGQPYLAGDVDGDGTLDLIAMLPSNGIAFLKGRGDGSFAAPFAYPLPAGISNENLRAYDLNGDGKLDLIALSILTGNDNSIPTGAALHVLIGNGDGSFTASVAPALTGFNLSPQVVAVADANGDTKPDLLVAIRGDNVIDAYFGVGDGTFHDPVTFAVGAAPMQVVVADFDGDGKADLATYNADDWSTSFLFGDGAGDFAGRADFPIGEAQTIIAGRFGGNVAALVVATSTINPTSSSFQTLSLGCQ